MLLALVVNTIGFLQILTQTFYSLHKNHVKANLLEALLVRWILMIILILLDNFCLGFFDILPFGTYIYNYYKLMIFISKSEFHVSMMQKFIVKADPDVLGELFLTMIARVMIRIMHKSCMVLKKLNLPVSQTDFNLSQEIMEFLEEYHPRIIKTSNNLNNSSLLDTTLNETPSDLEKELERKRQEERRQRKLEKERKEKLIEEEIQKQQEELLRLKQKKLQEIKGEYDESDQSGDDASKQESQNQQEDLLPQRDYSNDSKKRVSKVEIKKTNSITKIQKPSSLVSPVVPKKQTVDIQPTQKSQPLQEQIEKREYISSDKQLKQEEPEDDEDDELNNVDFNDSSSKLGEDSSSNEKMYAPKATVDSKKKQETILPDLLVEDDFEVLHNQDDFTKFKDGDVLKKKEIIGVKKSSSKTTSSGLPPTYLKSTTVKQSYSNTNSSIEKPKITSSVRENSSQKDGQSDSPVTVTASATKNNVDPSNLRTSSYSHKSKYSYTPEQSATLAQTRTRLDETKTQFELYKQKYANNTRFNQNSSLLDKDD